MKIQERLFRIVLTVALLQSGCGDKEIVSQSQDSSGKEDVVVQEIKDMMWVRVTNDNHPMNSLDKILSECSKVSEKRSIVKGVSDEFLNMTLSLEAQVNLNGSFENYLDFMSCILWRQQQVGFSEIERVEFFFKALEKYEEYVTLESSDDSVVDVSQQKKRDRVLLCRRDGFMNSTKFMKRHLFDYYIKGLGEENKKILECRFLEWHERVLEKVKSLEEKSLKHKCRLKR
jgi:hypothetical protein